MIRPTHVSGSNTTCDAPLSVSREGRPVALVVPLSGARREPIELTQGAVFSIGRGQSSSLVVDDPSVSRLHATLVWDGGDRVLLADRGSRNGTLVGGQRVSGEATIGHGTILDVGPQRLLVLLPSARVDALAPPSTTPMQRARDLARRAATSELPILLIGETGVGKEVLARAIHADSRRAAGPFVAQNCGALTESLAEATLFGHEKGAFTGAATRAIGVFEAASTGTLFLDEIGELSTSAQVRLLRVLERSEVVRVGATRPTPIDTRVIAATHRDLDAMVVAGSFRADLLYRLDVVRVVIPPLRERREELVALAEELLASLDPSGVVRLSEDAHARIASLPWPGNVRELRNAIARALTFRESDTLSAADFPAGETPAKGTSGPLRSAVSDVERDAIVAALEATNGNRTHAAQRLGIARRTLLYKIERLGIVSAKGSRTG